MPPRLLIESQTVLFFPAQQISREHFTNPPILEHSGTYIFSDTLFKFFNNLYRYTKS